MRKVSGVRSLWEVYGVSDEWHGIKHFLNSVSDVGWGEKCCDVW